MALTPLAFFVLALGSGGELLLYYLAALWFGALALLVWMVVGIAVLVEVRPRRRFGPVPVRVGG